MYFCRVLTIDFFSNIASFGFCHGFCLLFVTTAVRCFDVFLQSGSLSLLCRNWLIKTIEMIYSLILVWSSLHFVGSVVNENVVRKFFIKTASLGCCFLAGKGNLGTWWAVESRNLLATISRMRWIWHRSGHAVTSYRNGIDNGQRQQQKNQLLPFPRLNILNRNWLFYQISISIRIWEINWLKSPKSCHCWYKFKAIVHWHICSIPGLTLWGERKAKLVDIWNLVTTQHGFHLLPLVPRLRIIMTLP